ANAFTFTAIDAAGQQASVTVSIFGTQTQPGNIDFSQFSDISGSFAPGYSRTSFNDRHRTLYAEMLVRNLGQYSANKTLYVGVKNISDPTVQLRDYAGVTPDGLPYYDFTGLIGGASLSPNDKTGSLNLAFSDPNRRQFTYDLVIFGILNRPPAFTTVPPV